MKILGICGSLREKSYNKGLLEAAKGLAPENMEIEIVDLSEIPSFNQDLEMNLPEAVVEFKAKIEEADGLLFATPEYNYSVPGILKNAIDWASRPFGQNIFEGKPVAIMGASIGMSGTIRAQIALRQTFAYLNVYDMKKPEIYVTDATNKFSAESKLTDTDTSDHLSKFLQAFEIWVKKMTN